MERRRFSLRSRGGWVEQATNLVGQGIHGERLLQDRARFVRAQAHQAFRLGIARDEAVSNFVHRQRDQPSIPGLVVLSLPSGGGKGSLKFLSPPNPPGPCNPVPASPAPIAYTRWLRAEFARSSRQSGASPRSPVSTCAISSISCRLSDSSRKLASTPFRANVKTLSRSRSSARRVASQFSVR